MKKSEWKELKKRIDFAMGKITMSCSEAYKMKKLENSTEIIPPLVCFLIMEKDETISYKLLPMKVIHLIDMSEGHMYKQIVKTFLKFIEDQEKVLVIGEIVIFESHVKKMNKEDATPVDLTKSIANDPEATDAMILKVCTKDGISIWSQDMSTSSNPALPIDFGKRKKLMSYTTKEYKKIDHTGRLFENIFT